MAATTAETTVKDWQRNLPSDFAKNLFETGDYSDLQIKTPTRIFKVHQAFICSQSPTLASFVKTVSAHGNMRGNLRTPELTMEDKNLANKYMRVEDSVRVVLRWMYGLPNPNMRLPKNATPDQMLENFTRILSTRHAAVMFVMQDLIDYTSDIITERLEECRSTVHFAQMCVELFKQPVGQDKAVEKLAARFEEVVRDKDAWAIVKQEKELLGKVQEARRARVN